MSRFKFSELLLPLIQAPMAGGSNTPALVAAVCNSGGVGSFGFAYSQPSQIEQSFIQARELTTGPINANVFIFKEVEAPDEELIAAAMANLQNLPGCKHLKLNSPKPPYFINLNDQMDVIWKHKPAMITFHFGLPSASILHRSRALGILTGVTATSPAEGLIIEQAGVDFIIAQGVEAGGHRGVFEEGSSGGDVDERLPLLDLVARLKKRVRLPIVAAGGVMTGEDIYRCIQAGAVAAQLGTAFLVCDESGATQAHKRLILTEHSRGTVLTRVFSGRPANSIRNEFIDRLPDHDLLLPFPLQNALTSTVRAAAALRGDAEYQALYAGSSYPRARAMSAADLITALTNEYLSFLKP